MRYQLLCNITQFLRQLSLIDQSAAKKIYFQQQFAENRKRWIYKSRSSKVNNDWFYSYWKYPNSLHPEMTQETVIFFNKMLPNIKSAKICVVDYVEFGLFAQNC